MAMIGKQVQEILVLINLATSKVAGEPAHLRRLARASASHKNKACGLVMAQTQKCAFCFMELTRMFVLSLTLRTRDTGTIFLWFGKICDL